jgi:hypothetical protein
VYPVTGIYSMKAFKRWRELEGIHKSESLGAYQESWLDVKEGEWWEARTWDELRTAVSFLTLMNKRDVLYYRGQRAHHDQCVPVLFRDVWYLKGEGTPIPLSRANRGGYYERLLGELRREVFKVARRVGTPRSYILERVPAAAASVLQHYELWPTHFIDLTRSLATAVAFAAGSGKRERAYLYVFAMPDLRGSITSDIDQHITLSRLEAICPPAARRPHHQDAYLVARFPEPSGQARPDDPDWVDWQRKSDLMRRLVAKFLLRLEDGALPGTPRFESSFLTPDPTDDELGGALYESLLPTVERHVFELSSSV